MTDPVADVVIPEAARAILAGARKKPGPKKGTKPKARQTRLAPANPAQSTEQTTTRTAATRRRRHAGSARLKLSVPDIPGYRCYWPLNTPGRIEYLIECGYEFVSRDECNLNSFSLATDAGSSGNTDLGSRVSIAAGGINDAGTYARHYLMKIRQEWFDEDQALSQQLPDQIDQMIRGGQLGKDKQSVEDQAQVYSKQADLQTNLNTRRRFHG